MRVIPVVVDWTLIHGVQRLMPSRHSVGEARVSSKYLEQGLYRAHNLIVVID